MKLTKKNQNLYKDYRQLMASGVTGVYKFLRTKYDVSNQRITQIINKAEKIEANKESDYIKYKRKEDQRIAKLWDKKHLKRYVAIPHDRTKKTIDLLRKLIHDMTMDGYTQTAIADYFLDGEAQGGRKAIDRSTICHHVASLDLSDYPF